MNGDAVRYSNMVGYRVMARCGEGSWVAYEDYKDTCRQLDEAQRALAVCRVELAAIKKEMRVSLLSLGCCPECGRKVYNYTAPTSGDYEWIRGHGVDPTTNHRIGCSLGSM